MPVFIPVAVAAAVEAATAAFVFVGGAVTAIAAGALLNEALSKPSANENAESTTGACAGTKYTEATHPCRGVLRGKGSGPYRGGAHTQMTKPKGDRLESHHLIGNAVLIALGLDTNFGPAIQMPKEDHLQTQSQGSADTAKELRAEQTRQLCEGKYRQAFEKAKEEIKKLFPGKYDEALDESEEFLDCLEDKELTKRPKKCDELDR